MLNNVGNFYLSCFVVANAICNINRFVLQELGNVVVGILLLRIRGLIAGDDGVSFDMVLYTHVRHEVILRGLDT